MSMEPSSTAFCRAGALVTTIALISLGISGPAAARGVAAMGRVHAVRVVPRAPAQPGIVHGNVAPQQAMRPANQAVLGNRFRPHRFGRRTAGLFLPYNPYLVDFGGQPAAPQFPDGYDPGPGFAGFEQPACVRPLIIHIKPTRHARHFPRVIYGRPLPC
jgi:hypothetical protein